MNENPTDRVVDRKVLVRGRKFDVEEVALEAPDGRRLTRQMIRHPGAAVILPILGDQVVLVRNERFAVGRVVLELPAGTLDPGEDAMSCARRELVEETGYRAATVEPLCRFLSTPGMTDEVMHAYVARDLTHVGQRLEPDERIAVELRKIADVIADVEAGRMEDAKTMLTLLIAHRRGLLG